MAGTEQGLDRDQGGGTARSGCLVDILTTVDLGVAGPSWTADKDDLVISPEPPVLIGVGANFDGAEWHFYAVNAEPAAGRPQGGGRHAGTDGERPAQ